MNHITVIGNVTRDPELRFTQSGKPFASFSIADNRKRGEEEVASFFDVQTWDTLAENVAESLAKGMRVVVTGRLEQQTWEKDGEKKSRIVIVADEVGPSLRWAKAAVTKNERRSS